MRIIRNLREPLAYGLLWSAIAWVSLLLRDQGGAQTLIWVPSGVTLAAFYATRRVRWPLLCLVLLPMQSATMWLYGARFPDAVAYATSALVQTVIAASIGIVALGGRQVIPRKFRQVAGLFLAALTGSFVGAIIAMPFRAEQSLAEFAWWFLANVLAILTISPVLMLLRYALGMGTRNMHVALDRSFIWAASGCAALALLALQVNGNMLMPLLVAAMIFATVRYGHFASPLVILAYAAVAMGLSVFSGSPMPALDLPPENAALVLQIWMFTMLATALPVAAMLLKREELQLQLIERNAQMHESLMLFDLAEETAGIGRWRLDLVTQEQEWSLKMLDLHGLPRSLAPDPGDVRQMLPDGGDELFGQISAHRENREPFTFDYRVKPPEGAERILRISILNEFDMLGERIAVFGVAMDVTEQMRREEALDLARSRAMRLASEAQKLANTDPLTALPNRRCTFTRMEGMIDTAAKRGGTLTAIMFDVDHFKQVNDRHGHQTGDEVLVQVAELARRQARAGDLVGRIGGEEFVWLMPGLPDGAARKLAERLRRAVEAGIEGSALPGITVSIGVAHYRPGDSEESLLARADEALYLAKDNGRNQVRRAA